MKHFSYLTRHVDHHHNLKMMPCRTSTLHTRHGSRVFGLTINPESSRVESIFSSPSLDLTTRNSNSNLHEFQPSSRVESESMSIELSQVRVGLGLDSKDSKPV